VKSSRHCVCVIPSGAKIRSCVNSWNDFPLTFSTSDIATA